MGPEEAVAYIFFSGMPATGWAGVSWATETNPLAAPSDPEARAVSMAVGTAHQRARHRLAGGSPARAVPLRTGCPGSTHAEYRICMYLNVFTPLQSKVNLN